MIFILFSIYISYLDRTKRQHIAIPLKQEDAQTFDTICLNDPENINSNQDGVDGLTMPVLPQKTWTEMHDEFYAEPPKNPGKILLLYSPDTKQFKELQVSFTIDLEFIQLRKHKSTFSMWKNSWHHFYHFSESVPKFPGNGMSLCSSGFVWWGTFSNYLLWSRKVVGKFT